MAVEIELRRGDSYDNVANDKLAFTVDKNYTGWTGTFTVRHRNTYASLCSASVVVTSSVLLNVTLTASDTAFSALVNDEEFGAHPFDVQMTSGISVKTAVSGYAVISKDQTYT